MASKELERTVDTANSQPAPVALLEFGRLLHNGGQRPVADRNPTRLQQVEDQLINRLSTEKNSLLKPALNFNAGKPIDALGLRVLAVVAFHQLCTQRLVVTVSNVVQTVAGYDPAQVLEARRIVSQLLIAKQLILKPYMDGCLGLGEVMLNFLAGGKEATPITLTEFELDQRWRKAEALAAKRQAKASFEKLPSAKQLAAMIAKDVIGLDSQIRTLSCRLALHQRRACEVKKLVLAEFPRVASPRGTPHALYCVKTRFPRAS